MSDVDNKVKMIVEGLLLAAGRPLSLDNIIQVFSDDEKPDRKELKAVMDSIADDCDDRGFELIEVASGYRFQVKQDLSEWVAKLWEERPPRYTRALLETLALIAYRQPITRGDIEEIRGVGVSSNIIRTLLDREWVRIVGHRDVPGRPAMFATTRQFLDYFNLKSLQELPPLSEIKELDKINREFDLDEDMGDARVLELPEDVVDENSFETGTASADDLLAEEEAIALSKKPLDEILNLDPTESEQDEAVSNTDDADANPEDFSKADDAANEELPEAAKNIDDQEVEDNDSEAMNSSGENEETSVSEYDAEIENSEEIDELEIIADTDFETDNADVEDFENEPHSDAYMEGIDSSSMGFIIEDDIDEQDRG